MRLQRGNGFTPPSPSTILASAPSLAEVTKTISSLPPDKSTGVDGLSNRMLQAKSATFQHLLHFLISAIWELEVYPKSWQTALVIPIYKGNGQPKDDPASYRGIYLTCHVTKLFESLLMSRITAHMSAHGSATPHQFAQAGYQAHDAIYNLIGTAPNHKTQHNEPTHCAFIDFETAYPSVHRDRLSCLSFAAGFWGKIWRLIRTSYHNVFVRVLHLCIPASSREEILRGIPEGSKLSPPLFNLFVAELLSELCDRFPLDTTWTREGRTWVGALAFVDDIVLVSRNPYELQAMLNFCQEWCECSRMQINVAKPIQCPSSPIQPQLNFNGISTIAFPPHVAAHFRKLPALNTWVSLSTKPYP